MKKILFTSILFLILQISSAYAQDCNIYVWNDDGSLRDGPIATNEASRTILSTEEAANFVNNESNLDGCSSQCCSDTDSVYGVLPDGSEYSQTYYAGACIDGTWQRYSDGDLEHLSYYYDGTWDVICVDADLDGTPDDGDNSTTVGDNTCTGGNTENCDDNCRLVANPNQEDVDNDGVGDVCDPNTIYGTISGDAQEGIIVNIETYSCGVGELVATITTNAEGYYAFGGLENDKYGILPQHSNYIFNPGTVVIQIPQTNIQSFDFTATICNLLSECEAIFNDQNDACDIKYSACVDVYNSALAAWNECVYDLCQGGLICNGEPIYYCGFPPTNNCDSRNESCLETASIGMDQCVSNLCQ